MRELTEAGELDRLFQAERAVLFKHSRRCPISSRAHEEMERFEAAHPGVPVHLIDIHARRPLSDEVEARTGVKHESPQVLVLQGGRAAYHADRWDVDAGRLGERMTDDG